jgi:hypothetical protein
MEQCKSEFLQNLPGTGEKQPHQLRYPGEPAQDENGGSYPTTRSRRGQADQRAHRGRRLDYVDWWREPVIGGEAATKTANNDIGQLSRMLKDISVRRRHKIPEIFKGLRLRGATDRSRSPFEPLAKLQ